MSPDTPCRDVTEMRKSSRRTLEHRGATISQPGGQKLMKELVAH